MLFFVQLLARTNAPISWSFFSVSACITSSSGQKRLRGRANAQLFLIRSRIAGGSLFENNIGHPRIGPDRARIKKRAVVDPVWSAPENLRTGGLLLRCGFSLRDPEQN